METLILLLGIFLLLMGWGTKNKSPKGSWYTHTQAWNTATKALEELEADTAVSAEDRLNRQNAIYESYFNITDERYNPNTAPIHWSIGMMAFGVLTVIGGMFLAYLGQTWWLIPIGCIIFGFGYLSTPPEPKES